MSINRYYAIVKAGSDLTKPCPVLGWVAQTIPQDGTVAPYQAAAGFEAVTLNMSDEDWAARATAPQNPMQIHNGEISPYISPGPTLKEQAQQAMQGVQQRAGMMFAMGETFGPNMRAYVQKLRSLVDGTDTTSIVLPAAPADPNT